MSHANFQLLKKILRLHLTLNFQTEETDTKIHFICKQSQTCNSMLAMQSAAHYRIHIMDIVIFTSTYFTSDTGQKESIQLSSGEPTEITANPTNLHTKAPIERTPYHAYIGKNAQNQWKITEWLLGLNKKYLGSIHWWQGAITSWAGSEKLLSSELSILSGSSLQERLHAPKAISWVQYSIMQAILLRGGEQRNSPTRNEIINQHQGLGMHGVHQGYQGQVMTLGWLSRSSGKTWVGRIREGEQCIAGMQSGGFMAGIKMTPASPRWHFGCKRYRC